MTVQQALGLAEQHYKRGEYAQAHQLYSAVLASFPLNMQASGGIQRLKAAGYKPDADVEKKKRIDRAVSLFSKGDHGAALREVEDLLKRYPDEAALYNLSGAVKEALWDVDGAVSDYTKAIELRPEYADAYFNRGNAYKKAEWDEEALDSYRKACEINPKHVDAYLNCGNALRDLGRQEEAVSCFQKVLSLQPRQATACYNLANVYKDLGDVKQAKKFYEKALKIKPDFAECHRNLSTVKTFVSTDPQLRVMKALVKNPEVAPTQKMHVHFALAKAGDDLQNYDEAFAHFSEANRLAKQLHGYDKQSDEKLYAGIKAYFDAFQMGGVQPVAAASVVPIFIVGMPRSGTSLVEQILASHSEVHGAGELMHLTRLALPTIRAVQTPASDEERREETTALGRAYLDALERLPTEQRVITDKMPTNFLWLGFVLSALPNAKVVHVSREPMAVAWSIYQHYFSGESLGFAYDLEDIASFYEGYRELMAYWREKFPDKIYELDYEKLTTDQEEETWKLLAYCGLERETECLEFYSTKRSVRTASASQVRRKMYTGSSAVWRKYEKYLTPIAERLSPAGGQGK